MASAKQANLMQEFHDHSGWEFMGADRVKANDPEGFVEQWHQNIRWLRNVADETERLIDEYEMEMSV